MSTAAAVSKPATLSGNTAATSWTTTAGTIGGYSELNKYFFGNLYKYFYLAGTRVLVGQGACLLGWVLEVPGAAGCRQVGSVANIFVENVMIFPPQAAPA